MNAYKSAAEQIREILNSTECYAACPLKYKNAATKIVNDYIFLPNSPDGLIIKLSMYNANDNFIMERYLIQSLANIEFDMPMDWILTETGIRRVRTKNGLQPGDCSPRRR